MEQKREKKRGRVWQTMSGHDPAPRWSCLLYREKREDQKSERDRRRRVERERKKRERQRRREGEKERRRERDHWSATAHAVKRAIKRDAARPRDQVRISDVDRAGAPRREIAAINRKCVTSSIALSPSLSLSRQRTPRRSVNQVENPQELVLNPR